MLFWRPSPHLSPRTELRSVPPSYLRPQQHPNTAEITPGFPRGRSAAQREIQASEILPRPTSAEESLGEEQRGKGIRPGNKPVGTPEKREDGPTERTKE